MKYTQIFTLKCEWMFHCGDGNQMEIKTTDKYLKLLMFQPFKFIPICSSSIIN